MDYLSTRNNIKQKSDWYKITNDDIIAAGGASLLLILNRKSLIEEYTDSYDWQDWKFKHVYPNFWDSIINRKEYLNYLFEQLEFNELDDWYTCTNKDFINHNGASLLAKFGNIFNILNNTLVNNKWDKLRLVSGKKMQIRLFNWLKQILPNEKIIFDYLADDMRFSNTGRKMQLDIFVPKYKLAIEYQDKSHFEPIETYGGVETYNKVIKRDKEKIDSCNENKIKLLIFDCKSTLSKEKFNKIIKQELLATYHHNDK